jgi:hypothetical protein
MDLACGCGFMGERSGFWSESAAEMGGWCIWFGGFISGILSGVELLSG